MMFLLKVITSSLGSLTAELSVVVRGEDVLGGTIRRLTADCERGFSAVKRIKTVLRNRLKTQTLDCLMRISVEGPELENFNFENAATVWGSLRNRHCRIT